MALRQDHQLAHIDAYAVNKSDNALLLKHAGIATAAKVVKSKLMGIDPTTKALLVRWIDAAPFPIRGTIILPGGNTSVIVTHGYGGTPIFVVAVPNQNIGNVWITNITNTTFTINTSASSGSDTIFCWLAGGN